MQNPFGQTIDYQRYLTHFWKKKWLVIIPTVLFPLVAGYYAMQLQDQYRSTTLILVQPQRVPSNYVPSTVTTSISERLNTISQQIFSRTRLEEIIQEFNLFALQRKNLTPEEVIGMFRGKIQLKVHRNDAFELAYVDANPRLSMLVTNKLASLFIEENLKVREQQAIGTSQFLQDEIERVRAQVREKEQAVLAFKSKHLNELSDQLSGNQARLAQLQGQLQMNSQEISAAEDRKVRMQQSLADMEATVQREWEQRKAGGGIRTTSISDQLLDLFAAGPSEAGGPDEGKMKALEAEIQKQEREIERLKLTYTERHPDVVRVQGLVRRLKVQLEKEKAAVQAQREALEKERKASAANKTSEPLPEVQRDSGPVFPPAYARLKADIARADSDIARMKAQNQEIRKAMELYQTRISAVPARELQLKQTSEEYNNLKSVLDRLINNKLQADLSENLERKQKGEQFQILDPANLPEKPFFPNRMRYVGGGLVAGLALGVGLVLLLDLVDTSVRTREELASMVSVPVLGTIPVIITPLDRVRRRRLRLVLSGGAGVCLLFAAVVVHLAVKPIPEALGDLVSQVRTTHWTTMGR